MGETVKSTSIFKENYLGILTHEGTVKVAKSNITAKILHIDKNTVLVRGRKRKGYHCTIHKDLYPLMNYVETGDLAYVKWKSGKAWLVGFKKNTNKTKSSDIDGESNSDESDWNSFFNTKEME